MAKGGARIIYESICPNCNTKTYCVDLFESLKCCNCGKDYDIKDYVKIQLGVRKNVTKKN